MPLSPIREITNVKVRPLEPCLPVEFRGAKLENGHDLNFMGVETQHATHSIHPYVAAINPPLASSLISHYVPEGEVVLDPFCGGGGVLVEAVLQGRQAIGCDVNPLAVLMTQVKTTHLPSSRTFPVYLSVVEKAEKLARHVSMDDVPDVVRFWYRDDSLCPLNALKEIISEIENEALRRLFQIILSATARDVMLTYRGEIRLRKLQGKDLERFQPNVFVAFKKRALSAIKSVSELPAGRGAKVFTMDCRKLTPQQSCHTVITSPPYGDDKNGVGYFQFSRNMLFWIGISLEEQKRQRESFLGCGVDAHEKLQFSETLQQTLPVIRERKTIHHREAINFYSDYFHGLKRISEYAHERVIIVIGDRVLSRTRINNGHITTEFMRELGFGLEHYYTRQLLKKRIANLGGDGGGISLEHVMVFRSR
jgi:site-specific DNA-methyltransferase (cytosine-N4-specific)